MFYRNHAIVLGLMLSAGTCPAPAAPVPPPGVTVQSLFTEVLVGLDDQVQGGQWELFGAQALIQWPQGQPAAKGQALVALGKAPLDLPLAALTQKPVRLTDDAPSREFFAGVPAAAGQGVPRDGRWIGYKFGLFPGSLVDPAVLPAGGDAPLIFYLVKRAPADLTEADLEAPLSQAAEHALLQARADRCLVLRLAMTQDPRDLSQAQILDLAARAEAGDALAAFLVAEHDRFEGRPNGMIRARACYRLAAQEGLAPAELAYARMLGRGQGGAVDLAEAMVYLERAAAQGLTEAHLDLADRLRSEHGGMAPVAAVAHYQSAANQGSHQAQAFLAEAYETGTMGPQQDLRTARSYAKLAADQDAPHGLIRYGRMLRDGVGGGVELEEARRVFKRAARLLLPQGQFALAGMLREGLGGPVDVAEADLLLRRAAAAGVPEALAEFEAAHPGEDPRVLPGPQPAAAAVLPAPVWPDLAAPAGRWPRRAAARRTAGAPRPAPVMRGGPFDCLQAWFQANLAAPYPRPAELQDLAERSGLSMDQVRAWMINARMRPWH